MKFLTTEEVAEKLSINPHTARKWMKDGKFGKAIESGNRTYFRVTEVDIDNFMSA